MQDSPLWFCAANRTNWDYEYFWLPGHAWVVDFASAEHPCEDFSVVEDYAKPLLPPLNVEIDLDDARWALKSASKAVRRAFLVIRGLATSHSLG